MSLENFEDLLASWFGGRSTGDLDYAGLQEIARRWIAAFDDERAPPRESLTNARKYLEKREFGSFMEFFAGSSPLAKALVDLFMMARMRDRVLSYLSLQEGMDFDLRPPETAHVSRLLSELLASIGKRPWFVPRFRWGPLRLSLQLDPMVHLRPLYLARLLRSRGKRRSRSFLLWHHALFCVKVLALRIILAIFRRILSSRLSEDGIRGVYQSAFFQRNFCFGILVLFPDSHRIPHAEWNNFMSRIGDYFIPKIADFLRVVAPDSVADHGIIKLLKIGFGVIIWRLQSPSREDREPQEFILETLRLAYSWGTTYPLVDNVLDNSRTSPAVRHELLESLQDLFHTLEVPATFHDRGVEEAVRRLGEVLSLVPVEEQALAGNLLLHLLEAHQRDSGRRLSRSQYSAAIEDEVWTDTVLKAALIRLATIVVCGIPITPKTFGRQIVASLINQLGDDLWDIHQDMEEDRCTPFSYFLRHPYARNPFTWFIRYALLLSEDLTARRRSALLIGVIETYRCLLEDIARRGDDFLGILPAATDALRDDGYDLTLHLILSTPHLDPDSVLFSLEDAILGARKNEPISRRLT